MTAEAYLTRRDAVVSATHGNRNVHSTGDGRTTFFSDLSLEEVTVRLHDCRAIEAHHMDRIYDTFNRYGFLVLEHALNSHRRQQFLSLTRLFGDPVIHNRSASDGIVTVAVANNNDGYLSASHEAHALHTDGTFQAVPPVVMGLQCERPALKGGLTALLSGKALFNWLRKIDPTALAALFEPDVLTVERDNQRHTRPVLHRIDNVIHMSFRDDSTVSFSSQIGVQRAIHLIRQYFLQAHNLKVFKLLSNQILLVDNSAILHGRTSFGKEEKRRLHRLNFDGSGLFSRRLVFGFTEF